MTILKKKKVKFYVPNTAITRQRLIDYAISDEVVEAALGKTLPGLTSEGSIMVSSSDPKHPGWFFPKDSVEVL